MRSFFVPGVPAPGGSKRGFYNRKSNRVVIVEDCKRNKPWRDSVATAALALAPGPLLHEPIVLRVTFVMPRPKGHYGTGRNAGKLKDSSPKHHTVKPDATKLLRSTEDALTGIIWHDDSLIARQEVEKIYGETPGAHITVLTMKEDQQVATWRARAQFAIREAYEKAYKAGKSKQQIIEAIDAAYPFGERANYPYKAWLEERKSFLVYKNLREPKPNKNDVPVEFFGNFS